MNILVIIQKIDELLEKTGKKYIDPVEANSILAKAGLLMDSNTRPGKPLRNILIKGLITHAYQSSGKDSSWFIPHSGALKKKEEVYKSVHLTMSDPKANPIIKNEATKGPNLFNTISKMQKAGFEGFSPIATLINNTNKRHLHKYDIAKARRALIPFNECKIVRVETLLSESGRIILTKFSCTSFKEILCRNNSVRLVQKSFKKKQIFSDLIFPIL